MVISGAISPLIWLISIVTLLITPLIATHEPPSTESRHGEKARPEECGHRHHRAARSLPLRPGEAGAESRASGFLGYRVCAGFRV